MNIEKSMSEKTTITGIPRWGTVAVYSEDFGPGKGKLTITHDGDSWTHYWGAMHESTLKAFVLQADNHYLIGKLRPGLDDKIPICDADTVLAAVRSSICEARRQGEFSKERARELWEDAAVYIDNAVDLYTDKDLVWEVYESVWGPEWYEKFPKEPNREWERMASILDSIKAAWKQE